jgi:hypothetical protein
MRRHGRWNWNTDVWTGDNCDKEWAMTAIIVPVVVMVLFSALYSGAYIWMRRESFGEGRRKAKAGRSHHH